MDRHDHAPRRWEPTRVACGDGCTAASRTLPRYQLWLSAVGLQPQDNAVFTRTYPWLGVRIAVIGDPRR